MSYSPEESVFAELKHLRYFLQKSDLNLIILQKDEEGEVTVLVR